MNKLIGGLALLFLVGGAGSSAHADGPWCAFYDASTYNCGFYSFEQCYETVRGVGGSCRPNFFKSNVVAQPAGRRVSAAPENAAALERTRHGDARKCAIEPSADLLQPCSLPPPWASAPR